jgi:hypothetical protein
VLQTGIPRPEVIGSEAHTDLSQGFQGWWTGQLFVDTSVAIIEGNDRGIYEQQSAVHG